MPAGATKRLADGLLTHSLWGCVSTPCLKVAISCQKISEDKHSCVHIALNGGWVYPITTQGGVVVT